ncbi:hypothetical protein ACQJBY_042436 [Aegilops geniculata]
MVGDEIQPLEHPDATPASGDVREEEDHLARLPEDVLAGVLRRVPPLWFAASRCVCTAWRDAIDAHGLLRADLLPLSLAGLFVHFNEHKFPEFLARPSSAADGARAVNGNLSFLPSASPHCGYFWQEDCADWCHYNIEDHCNGLLLLRNNWVVNPAMRWWNTLPKCPANHDKGNVRYHGHLVYDPMVSPYYEVFMTPWLDNYHPRDEVDPSMEESEWPPSLCKMYVFSSKSGSWEEKYFLREGDAAGIVGQLRVGYRRLSAVYFRGALYVHCRADWIMRIALSNNTYSVIKPPVDTRAHYFSHIEVVRSKKGVYFVVFDRRWPQYKCWLGVWILDESCGQMEWILKHDKNLKHVLARHCRYGGQLYWMLEDINYSLFRSSSFPEDIKKAATKENLEWYSDDDVENEGIVKQCCLENNKKSIVEKEFDWKSNNHNALNDDNMVEACYWDEEHYDGSYDEERYWDEDIEILGFHPYKEIVFLSASERTALAYNLNGSKVEELGNIYPKDYVYFKELGNERETIKSFPYTPCWIEEFPGNN